MKILQANCVYNKGSTGKIMHDVHIELKKDGFSSVVCYGRGEVVNESNVYKTCGELYSKFNNLLTRFTGVKYGGCFFSTNKLIKIIKKEKPDIVHLHCINGYFVNIYRLINWLKKNNIKTLLTLHAEFMYTANCGHALECEKWKQGCGKCPRCKDETRSLFIDNTAFSWRLMNKAFSGFDKNLYISSVSPWLMERAKMSTILGNKHHEVVMNGLDADIFRLLDVKDLAKELGYDNKKIILHVTANFNDIPGNLKGGVYIIELARRMPECLFLVACSDCSVKNLPPNLIVLGNVENQQELAKYYNIASATVITSQKETFSMPTAESLCCGTPVVGFVAGGPESIGIEEYSIFSEYGNIDLLQKNLEMVLEKAFNKSEIAKKAVDKYSKKTMTNGYISLYKKINTEIQE